MREKLLQKLVYAYRSVKKIGHRMHKKLLLQWILGLTCEKNWWPMQKNSTQNMCLMMISVHIKKLKVGGRALGWKRCDPSGLTLKLRFRNKICADARLNICEE
jgi:hypothetical protein